MNSSKIFNKINIYNLQIYKLNISIFLRAMILLFPVMLLFYNENGLIVSDLFFFQGIFYLVSILLEIPVGYLSDNIPKKQVLFISLFTFFVMNVLWFIFKGYYVILLGEILFAISKVTLDNALSGYLYDYLLIKNEDQNKKMVLKYGHTQFFLSIGTSISSLLGTYLYMHYGSKIVLVTQMFILAIGMFLINSLPKLKYNRSNLNIQEKFNKYFITTKNIIKNKHIMYYIYYSGLFTSFSIVLALSFQPLMINAFVPIIFFGIIAFINHFTRAISAMFTGKISRFFTLKQMIIPLFILYIIAFLCIFTILRISNIYLIIFLIILVCFIIAFQLIFTIRHVCRLHKFVNSDDRGNIISINNFVSRILTFVMLFSSKFFIDVFGFEKYYIFIFIIFFVSCLTLMLKIYNIKEEI